MGKRGIEARKQRVFLLPACIRIKIGSERMVNGNIFSTAHGLPFIKIPANPEETQ
jgi:hypothetical protein